MTGAFDIDRLPPVQYLVMEVLAARYRLGEEIWPFPTSVAGALAKLEAAGLIRRMGSSVPRSVRASLTETGKAVALGPRYRAPNGGVEKPRQALKFIAEFAEERADFVIGMNAIAKAARAGLEGQS